MKVDTIFPSLLPCMHVSLVDYIGVRAVCDGDGDGGYEWMDGLMG